MRIKDLKVKDLLDKSPEYCLGASRALALYCFGETDSLETLEDAINEWQHEDTFATEDLYHTIDKLERYHNIVFGNLLDGEEEALKQLINLNKIQLIKDYWWLLNTIHLETQHSQHQDGTPRHKLEDDWMSGGDEVVKGKELLETAAEDLEHEKQMKFHMREPAQEKWEDTLDVEQYVLPDASDEEIVSDQSKDGNLNVRNFFDSLRCDGDVYIAGHEIDGGGW